MILKKSLSKFSVQDTFLNIIKALYEKPQPVSYRTGTCWRHSHYILDQKRMPSLTLLFSTILEVLNIAMRQVKKIKGIQILEDAKWFLFANGKVIGYKINTQKSIAFVYTDDSISEKELVGSVPFITAAKKLKYLGLNVAKDVRNLYDKNYKTLNNEIAENKTWKKHPYLKTANWYYQNELLAKDIYVLNAILIKIITTFFSVIGKMLKFIRKHKRFQIANKFAATKSWRHLIPDFKIHVLEIYQNCLVLAKKERKIWRWILMGQKRTSRN